MMITSLRCSSETVEIRIVGAGRGNLLAGGHWVDGPARVSDGFGGGITSVLRFLRDLVFIYIPFLACGD